MKQTSLMVNNFAVIQYELKDGTTQILMIGDHDIRNLKHTVSIYMSTRDRFLSVQFFYNVDVKDDMRLIREGVIIE